MKKGATQDKRKVLIMTNHSFMLWQFRRELIERLLEENTVILCMPLGEHVDGFKQMGCKIINTPSLNRRGMNPFKDMDLFRQYRKILRELKPDLVITYSIKPNIYGGFACRLAGIPYCVNVQGLGTAFQKKGLAQMVTRMYRVAIRRAKTVFFENDGNAKEFLRRKIVSRDQITVLRGAGINLEYYDAIPYQEQEGVHFLYVGRIMREKGMDEFFAAAQKIKEKYKEKVVFDMVGFFEDEYKEKVEQLEREGVLTFHGFQSDVRPFYDKANCVVLPSYHEGMSNVLLEAASSGRALITSNIPGCREAVQEGKSGFLCEVKNTDSLAEAMERFLKLTALQREEMGSQGRLHMEKCFDKKLVVQKTMEKLWK